MVNKKNLDRIFMILFGIIGFILFVSCANSFDKISKNCKNTFMKNGLLVMLILSAGLITIAISYSICNWKGQCYQNNTGKTSTSYLYLVVILSLIMSILLIIMIATLKEAEGGDCLGTTDKEKKNVKTLKSNIWAMFSMCIILLSVSGLGIFYIKKQNYS